ncbi:MAG: DNA mismatch repair endonuclease MutL [Candidatus Nanoarchaeia archaeon]|nr:DNA mismatch repair endonuclease MutL [Candidatus Nanoarchaeia archaeon]
MKIKELPIETINKISAGEVVVDSTSVVKELIENSIDANSTKIQIDLIENGKKSIILTDNGEGIEKDDLILTIKRHATSKIYDEEDLFNISSMGFRGEALYSISSVSHFSIISKPKNQEIGYGLFVNEVFDETNSETKDKINSETKNKINSNILIIDNKKVEVKPSPINEGTKIIVNDLFYNIPVRKKFLTNSTNLLKNIIQIIENFSIIYPNIDFILTNKKNEKKQELINTTQKNQKKRIQDFFELNNEDIYDFKKNIMFNEFETKKNEFNQEKLKENTNDLEKNHFIKVNGFISSPYKNFSNKKLHIFVNNRLIDYKIINDAIYNAHKTFLFVNRHPFVFLDIKVNPIDIDVNIHPSKKEIKYRFESTLYHFIYELIKETLYENTKAREITQNESKKDNTNEIKKNIYNFENHKDYQDEKNEIQRQNNIRQKEINLENEIINDDIEERKINEKIINQIKIDNDNNSNKEINNINIKDFENQNINKKYNNFYQDKLSINEETQQYEENKNDNNNFNSNNIKLKVIGVFHDTYFLIELNEELYIVDQHALEERLNYEKNMKEYLNNSISIQNLIQPVILELTNTQYLTSINNKEKIEKFGFIFDDFGDKSIVIRSIPIILQKQSSIDLFKELIDNIEKEETNIEEIINKTIISMSCKESIKANNLISNDYIKNVFLKTLELNNPYQCPHGRPTMIKYSLNDIEKLFKRK